MIAELEGSVPSIDYAYGKTLINEAYGDVRRLGGWSFQFGETGFTVPGLIGGGEPSDIGTSYGLVTLQFGSPYVIGDAVSTSTWNTPGVGSQYGSLISQRQFRSGG